MAEQFIVTFKHLDLFWNEENNPCFLDPYFFYVFWYLCLLFPAFQVQIQNKKIDLSHVTSKCGSLDNIHHRPGNRKQSRCWFGVSNLGFLQSNLTKTNLSQVWVGSLQASFRCFTSPAALLSSKCVTSSHIICLCLRLKPLLIYLLSCTP